MKGSVRVLVFTLTAMVVLLGIASSAAATVTDFHQARNNFNKSNYGEIYWWLSEVSANDSVYFESMSVPYRLAFRDLDATASGNHEVHFSLEFAKGNYVYDLLTGSNAFDDPATEELDESLPSGDLPWSQNEEDAWDHGMDLDFSPGGVVRGAGPIEGNVGAATYAAVMGSAYHAKALCPNDPYSGVQAKIDAYETLYGNRFIDIFSDNTISNVSLSLAHTSFGGRDWITYTLKWKGPANTITDVVIAFGGHLAVGYDGTAFSWGTAANPMVGAAASNGMSAHSQMDFVDVGVGAVTNQINTNAIHAATLKSGVKYIETGTDGVYTPGFDELKNDWEIRAYLDTSKNGLLEPAEAALGYYSCVTGSGILADGAYKLELPGEGVPGPDDTTLTATGMNWIIVEVAQEDFKQVAPTVDVVNGTIAGIEQYGYVVPVAWSQIHEDNDFGNIPWFTRRALDVEKTAAGSYDRLVTWELTKSIAPASHSGGPGDSFSSTWTVIATKTAVDSNFQVTGTITITNDNDIPKDFTVTDVLDDLTVASVSCPSSSVPAHGSVVCSYTASPTTKAATSNTVTVTASPAGDTDTEAITWTEHLTGYESGLLTDTHLGIGQTISDSITLTPPETFTCPTDLSLYTNGSYTNTVPNTATLDSGIGLSASASHVLTCTLPALQVTKTAAGTWDRDVDWTLTKSVTPASHTGGPGDSFSSTWSVVATKIVDGPGNYAVTGSISIHNPADVDQTFTVADVLNDAAETAGTVSCPTYTVAAFGDVVCTYTAAPADATATENEATVTAPGNPAQSDTDPIEWTENLTGYDSGLLSDPHLGISQTISGDTTLNEPETFTCPLDTGQYVNGLYTFTVPNTVTLDGNIGLSASAEVSVTCHEAWGPPQTATGAGTKYPGTKNWFRYSAYSETKIDLVTGKSLKDVGDIWMWRVGTSTWIKIDLIDGVRWAENGTNLYVQPYYGAPTMYQEPGSFQWKFVVSGDPIQVEIPGSSGASHFGIHGSIQFQL